jgi:hypothetical protein
MKQAVNVSLQKKHHQAENKRPALYKSTRYSKIKVISPVQLLADETNQEIVGDEEGCILTPRWIYVHTLRIVWTYPVSLSHINI